MGGIMESPYCPTCGQQKPVPSVTPNIEKEIARVAAWMDRIFQEEAKKDVP